MISPEKTLAAGNGLIWHGFILAFKLKWLTNKIPNNPVFHIIFLLSIYFNLVGIFPKKYWPNGIKLLEWITLPYEFHQKTQNISPNLFETIKFVYFIQMTVHSCFISSECWVAYQTGTHYVYVREYRIDKLEFPLKTTECMCSVYIHCLWCMCTLINWTCFCVRVCVCMLLFYLKWIFVRWYIDTSNLKCSPHVCVFKHKHQYIQWKFIYIVSIIRYVCIVL